MTTEPSVGTYPRLAFIVDEARFAGFCLLLQQGVKIRRRVGCSVDMFLREEIGAAPEMIEQIQSIMLDGKPVDDIGSALVHDGSVLALSAAMPGLVGATLRRGGAYSSFRSVITYRETETACAPVEGWVRVKVFNLLMSTLGPDLLRKGVLVSAADLFGLLIERAGELGKGCSVTIDDRPIDIGMLGKSTLPAGKEQVFLTVDVGPADA